MWLLYRALLALAVPFVLLRLYWRGRRAPGYRQRVGERFGRLPPDVPSGAIWVHAVSAGEVAAAAPLIERLLEMNDSPVLVTTMTPTGSEAVARLFGERVAHCYAPYDFCRSVARFVARTRPRALLLIETELWPNLIRQTRGTGAPVLLLNARLSARSARGYGRIRGFTQDVLSRIDWIAAQFQADADRFVQLGARRERVAVTGSLKFDQPAASPVAAEFVASLRKRLIGQRPVWIAGSTHPGEDETILAAHRLLRVDYPEALLMLAPRHPERFEAVAALADDLHLARLSTIEDVIENQEIDSQNDGADADISSRPGVLLVDEMGRLRELFPLARMAFVGGSLVERGGHNPIEPAAVGVPIVMGPSRFNFAGVVEPFVAADCLWEVRDARSLHQALVEGFSDDAMLATAGARARAVVGASAGALERQYRGVMAVLESNPHAQPS